MFAKLATVIVTLGVVACVLLAVRQQRVQTAHELAEVQRRVLEHDRLLLRIRAEIAQRTTPEQTALAASRLGPLLPNNADRYEDFLRREQAADAVSLAEPPQRRSRAIR